VTTLRFLTSTDFDPVLAAFNEAFADYYLPFHLGPAQFEEMIRRRGIVLELSAAAFDEGRIVGFTLNALGTWDNSGAAYDSGTGVVPSHRRLSLARRLMDQTIPALREAGAQTFVLEVLEVNERAFDLYRKLGFEPTRKLDCWRIDIAGLKNSSIAELSIDDIPDDFSEVKPSWQNSLECLRRSSDDRTVFALHDRSRLLGYAIVHLATGDLAQLAVAREHRRKGYGTRLLQHAAAAAGKPLRMINVDAGADAARAFLTASGAQRFITQTEMTRGL
jgi:ribosomal protein S18 acetylase RimI-like enzyme